METSDLLASAVEVCRGGRLIEGSQCKSQQPCAAVMKKIGAADGRDAAELQKRRSELQRDM